ncbi:uncharacterized protein SCHCODRAFT_02746014 [Schizophyllum commune H4-8]|uniref:uncharacterized protein n=1 Tax=Schizophyllum commune (strain H4-8 / FGSC 9210) TaxID=578458 RepID=UPI00215DE560|nr:uncharacterized protein SCHCODRAFT_02746014 [Schizophyllum commune H4-8]KAI5897165.1 hypothetical protein SCHCODRAFT_02746014 [Schizophyllum commune H4-8]
MPTSASSGRRKMNLIASVSRSSGLERGGDDLKDYAIQEEYRAFIQGKLDDAPEIWQMHGVHKLSTEEAERRAETRDNILILLRKLREGISASKRTDAFAIEVYETSLFLAVISSNHRRISPIVSQITPELYQGIERPHPNATLALTIALLYHLATSFPSQAVYQQQLASFQQGSPSLLPPDSPEYTWIKALAASLRQMNVARFSRLAKPSAIPISAPDELAHALDDLSLGERTTPAAPRSPTATAQSLTTTPQGPAATARNPTIPRSSRALAENALHAALGMLRERVCDHAWSVLRAAYKELSSTADGAPWLARSLALGGGPDSNDGESGSEELTRWLEEQEQLGRVKRKEGLEGRWLVCKS